MIKCKCMKDDRIGMLIRKWGDAECRIRDYLTGCDNGMEQECDCEDPDDTVWLPSDDDYKYNARYCCKCGGYIPWEN